MPLQCSWNLIDQSKIISLECAVISPLSNLYALSQSYDIRVGSVKILLHVLEVIFLSSIHNVSFSWFTMHFFVWLMNCSEAGGEIALQLAQYSRNVKVLYLIFFNDVISDDLSYSLWMFFPISRSVAHASEKDLIALGFQVSEESIIKLTLFSRSFLVFEFFSCNWLSWNSLLTSIIILWGKCAMYYKLPVIDRLATH